MTAYEMRISDWSSDGALPILSACMDASSASTLSTLPLSSFIAGPRLPARSSRYLGDELFVFSARAERNLVEVGKSYRSEERRVGKSVSVRVDLGGRRIIKKKNNIHLLTRQRTKTILIT